jgi:hypothetical protein
MESSLYCGWLPSGCVRGGPQKSDKSDKEMFAGSGGKARPTSVSRDVIKTAFLSAKNIATVYAEVHSILHANGITAGTSFVPLVTNVMRQLFQRVDVRKLQQAAGSAKAAILAMNEEVVREAVVAIRRAWSSRPRQADIPEPEEVPWSREAGNRAAESREEGNREVQSWEQNEFEQPFSEQPTRCTAIEDIRDASKDIPWSHVEDVRREPTCNQAPRGRLTEEHFMVKEERFTGMATEECFTVHSSKRDHDKWKTPDRYTVELYHLPPLEEICLQKMELAPLEFTITENNNRLYFAEDDDDMLVVSVPPGAWDIHGLLRLVEDIMNKLGRYRYRVRLDNVTQRVLIEQTGPVRSSQLHLLFEQTQRNLGKVLGFPAVDKRGMRAYSGEHPYELRVAGSVFLYCDELRSDGRPVATIALAGPIIEISQVIYKGSPLKLDILSFRFEDSSGEPFYFGNRDHVMYFSGVTARDFARDFVRIENARPALVLQERAASPNFSEEDYS